MGLASALAVWGQAAGQGSVRVEVLDRSFDTAASMFAYTEFELSGEPLAERLGLDLDALSPDQIDRPTRFDYVAGIESYEYSEEAMYALDYQSRMGVHLVNGPANGARGGTLETLGKRFIALADAVKFAADELPLNLYPLSLPYHAGSPEFAGPVDTREVGRDAVQVRRGEGPERQLQIVIPAYFRDFESLAWVGTAQPLLTPGALGGALLKEVMWSQDFLGGMHTVPGDEEVEASSASMDADGSHALGVSSVDGVNGVILTEIAWDKLWTLQDRLAYDGEKLGAKFGFDYDPAKKPIWFPSQIRAGAAQRNGVNALGELQVADASSALRDSWLLLWAASEFFAFSDARSAHGGQNPAFLALFDGAPFPAAPPVNRDADPANDRVGTDPFSIAANVSQLLFKNLDALHFDAEAGTFVDRWAPGTRGGEISALDAAYAIAALAVYQRAIDALPVGYASGEAAQPGLQSAQGARALELIRRQASFIAQKLMQPSGLVADRYTLASGAAQGSSLASQFAAIRGLTAAFTATGDASFKAAARKIFLALERERFDPALGTYADARGAATEHTPWTAGAISGGLRALLLNLRQEEGEDIPELAPARLTERYTAWFRGVINGESSEAGMQLAEWLGDSGENVLAPAAAADGAGAGAAPGTPAAAPSSDTDGDGVPQVTGAGGPHGTAMTLAARVRVSAGADRARTAGE